MATDGRTAGEIQRVRDITEELLELDDDDLTPALREGLQRLDRRMSQALSQKTAELALSQKTGNLLL